MSYKLAIRRSMVRKIIKYIIIGIVCIFVFNMYNDYRTNESTKDNTYVYGGSDGSTYDDSYDYPGEKKVLKTLQIIWEGDTIVNIR